LFVNGWFFFGGKFFRGGFFSVGRFFGGRFFGGFFFLVAFFVVVFFSTWLRSLRGFCFWFSFRFGFSFGLGSFFVAGFFARRFFYARKFSGVFPLGVRLVLVGSGCISEWVAVGPGVWRAVFLADFAILWTFGVFASLKSPCRA